MSHPSLSMQTPPACIPRPRTCRRQSLAVFGILGTVLSTLAFSTCVHSRPSHTQHKTVVAFSAPWARGKAYSTTTRPRREVVLLSMAMLTSGSAAVTGMPLGANAEQAPARLAVVEAYPPFGSLVPLEGLLDLAVSAAQAASDTDRYPLVIARFKQLSDTDLDAYRFMCTQYIGAIKYADPDEKLIGYDRAGRFKACDDAMSAVKRARDLLTGNKMEKAALQREVSAIGQNLAGFLSLVPKDDLKRAGRLSAKLRALDSDGDGKLSDDELQTVKSRRTPLSPEDLEVVSALRSIGLRDLLIP